MKRYLIGFALASSVLGMTSAAYGQLTPSPGTAASIEGQKKDDKVPFYGLSFDFTINDGTGLNSVGQNYRNDLIFYFEPTWNVGARFFKKTWAKTFAIAARFSVTQELSGTDDSSFNGVSNTGPHGTCSNITPSSNGGLVDPTTVGYCNPAGNDRRADYSDVWLTFKLPKVYTIPKLAVSISPSLRFVLPTSQESRYQTLQIAMTPSVSLSRNFWKDRIHVGYGLGFTKNFHSQPIGQIDPQTGGLAGTTGGNSFDGTVGTSISNFYNDPSRVGSVGGYNVNYQVTQSFSGGIVFNDKWSFDILYLLLNAYTYDPGCNYAVNGQSYDLCQSGNAVAANSGSSLNRDTKGPNQVFWATLGYQPLDWLGVSLALITFSPTYKPDSTYRQGIISTDYNAFSTVNLSATVTIDKLVNKFRKN